MSPVPLRAQPEHGHQREANTVTFPWSLSMASPLTIVFSSRKNEKQLRWRRIGSLLRCMCDRADLSLFGSLGRGGEGLRVYSDSTDVPRMEHGEGSPQPVTKQQFLSF